MSRFTRGALFLLVAVVVARCRERPVGHQVKILLIFVHMAVQREAFETGRHQAKLRRGGRVCVCEGVGFKGILAISVSGVKSPT